MSVYSQIYLWRPTLFSYFFIFLKSRIFWGCARRVNPLTYIFFRQFLHFAEIWRSSATRPAAMKHIKDPAVCFLNFNFLSHFFKNTVVVITQFRTPGSFRYQRQFPGIILPKLKELGDDICLDRLSKDCTIVYYCWSQPYSPFFQNLYTQKSSWFICLPLLLLSFLFIYSLLCVTVAIIMLIICPLWNVYLSNSHLARKSLCISLCYMLSFWQEKLDMLTHIKKLIYVAQ